VIYMQKVLFVCTANRCRSPMAERLFLNILRSHDRHPDHWQVTSAGTWAVNGIAPDDHLIATMDGFDIDIRDHRSQMLDAATIQRQDLILVMEYHHQEALCFEFPEKCDAIFLVSQMIEKFFEISDPFRCPIKAYQKTAQQLDMILRQGFEKIVQLSQS
jgi:protein-tyrosine-phosphatase